MIEGLFDEDEDLGYYVMPADQVKSDSLAGDMISPPMARGESRFLGLLNQ